MSTRRRFLHGSTAFAVAAMPFGSAARAGSASEARHPGPRASHEAPGEFTQRLEAARAATGVTGASFAYWDGKALHTAVAGVRNSVTQDPVTSDTLMHIGSITKVMNATLLMQLVDEDRIALDDPVLKHLPQFHLRDTQALKKITCRMLVNHTSGINGEWLAEYGPDKERIVDSVERCAQLDQLFAPGEETSYCNMATVIAGYLTQTLRDQSWYILMKSRIYEPLGLEHALVDPLEVPRYRVSIGDLTDVATGKLVQTTRPFLAPSFAPAGSTQMSTAADLVSFACALLNGGVARNGKRIVSAASAQRMSEPTAEFVSVGASSLKVGLGWLILPGGVLGHGGGGPGVRSQLYAQPASGRAMALLTNCDRGEALMAAFLDPMVESWSGIKPTKPKRLSVAVDTRAYLGSYENNADRYDVAAEKGALALRTQDKLSSFDNSNQEQPATALFPVGNDTFMGTSPAGSEVAIRFVRPDGRGHMRFLASGERLLARAT